MQSSTSHRSLHSFGWCVVLLLISTQSWGGCVNGQGTYTSASGDQYVGEWKDGTQHGQGTETGTLGTVLKAGIWENDEFVRTFEEEEQRALQEAVAKEQREREARRRERIYNACLLDKSDGVDMSIRSLEMAVRETCTEISKNPSWLDGLRYD